MRIVSLLPSATEILCILGLRDQIVGVTHECDYPPSVIGLPQVTSTLIPHEAESCVIDQLVRERLQTQRALYTLNFDLLASLRPDLLVTQALCDVCAVAEAEVIDAACRLPNAPQVVNLEPMSLADVYHTLLAVGRVTGVEARARQIVAGLQARVAAVAARTATVTKCPRVAHLEWIDPIFNAGHWTPELIELAGGEDVFGNGGQPSRTKSWEAIVDAQPEVMTIALCGFGIARARDDLPILAAQPGWRDLPCVRGRRVFLIDGNHYFNRPGPRLVESLEIMAHVLHPTVHPLPADVIPPIQVA
jgi:iron complex transport system substrate-binding protein